MEINTRVDDYYGICKCTIELTSYEEVKEIQRLLAAVNGDALQENTAVMCNKISRAISGTVGAFGGISLDR